MEEWIIEQSTAVGLFWPSLWERAPRASQDTIFNIFPLQRHYHLGYSQQSCVHVNARTRVSLPACGMCIMHYTVVSVCVFARVCVYTSVCVCVFVSVRVWVTENLCVISCLHRDTIRYTHAGCHRHLQASAETPERQPPPSAASSACRCISDVIRSVRLLLPWWQRDAY